MDEIISAAQQIAAAKPASDDAEEGSE